MSMNRWVITMGSEQLTYIFVIGSFVIYIGIAIWSRAATTREFYVAGSGVTPLANGMATAADWAATGMAPVETPATSTATALTDAIDRWRMVPPRYS